MMHVCLCVSYRVNGSLKSLEVILESGHADVDCLTADRETPLLLAAAKVGGCN